MANITKFEWLNDTSNGTIVKVEAFDGTKWGVIWDLNNNEENSLTFSPPILDIDETAYNGYEYWITPSHIASNGISISELPLGLEQNFTYMNDALVIRVANLSELIAGTYNCPVITSSDTEVYNGTLTINVKQQRKIYYRFNDSEELIPLSIESSNGSGDTYLLYDNITTDSSATIFLYIEDDDDYKSMGYQGTSVIWLNNAINVQDYGQDDYRTYEFEYLVYYLDMTGNASGQLNLNGNSKFRNASIIFDIGLQEP